MEFIIADLIKPEGIEAVVAQLVTRKVPIDVFIHNAGISAVGQFSQLNINRQQAVMSLNLVAPLLLTARLHSEFPDCSWVFMSTLAHFMGYPGATVYSASKTGLASFAHSLNCAGFKTLTVYPGPTNTDHASRYAPSNTKAIVSRRMAPCVLADYIYAAVDTKKVELVPGFLNYCMSWFGWAYPRLSGWIIKKAILDKLGDRQLV
eukprot:TRINITY_DN66321_c3_g1_i1.p1 TRINITY_DN66321_c3_g1~~TRINITY_DN66321_c3_g1_i1.p1  ORF type:complete len:205 (-),score=6.13 TRINITY_DN66321_c3_g1_i1:741-1355(-)